MRCCHWSARCRTSSPAGSTPRPRGRSCSAPPSGPIEDDTIQGTDAEAGKLAHGIFPVRIREPGRDDQIETQRVGSAPLFDANGFLMVLRGWEAEPGTPATADVIRSRYVWRAELVHRGFESLDTELGELPALRIDGIARRLGRDGEVEAGGDTRRYSIWVSDDADRVPLRMVARAYYGDVLIDLIEYQPGSGAPVGRR